MYRIYPLPGLKKCIDYYLTHKTQIKIEKKDFLGMVFEKFDSYK